jgi:class 3 adenylate cyclase
MTDFCWQFRFDASANRVWPHVSDMQRVEKAIGAPDVDFDNTAEPRGGSVLHGRARQLGMELEWSERPFEWVAEKRYCIERIYTKGPLLNAISVVELHSEGETTLVVQTMTIIGRNLFWDFVARFVVGFQMRRAFLAAYQGVADHLLSDLEPAFPLTKAPAVNRSRLKTLTRRLASTADPDMCQLLHALITEGDDFELAGLRPFVWADKLKRDRRDVLCFLMRATDVGLMSLTWNILCSQCRNAAVTTSQLGEVENWVHCDACKIDYRGNISENVEVVFWPSLSVRKVEMENYCVADPQTTKHILVQLIVAPGKTRTNRLHLVPGDYTARGRYFSGDWSVKVADSGFSELTVTPTSENEPVQQVSRDFNLTLHNDEDHEHVFVLERVTRRDDAATADIVTTMAAFRDIYAKTALALGESFQVACLYFLFTDVESSVRLYETLGDAKAYDAIRGHFRATQEVVENNQGAVVKTIGDSVMAVFHDPIAALRAAGELRGGPEVSCPPGLTVELEIRIGVHGGPCMAISRDGQMDYFGRTVNIAARLQAIGARDDIVISSAVEELAEVTMFLDGTLWSVSREEVDLKGLDETMTITRIRTAP